MKKQRKSGSGRPQEYVYIATQRTFRAVRRYEGSISEIAERFRYNPNTLYRGIHKAEIYGDGVFRPKHAPGLEITRVRL